MSDSTAGSLASRLRLLLVLVAFGAFLTAPLDCALAAERPPTAPLHVAVYDLPPYGAVGSDGALSGVSVDLWRRVAEELQWEYILTPVSQMESIISGLEQGRFDAAIGAITITPDREERVDFSYPAHRSGVAVALRKETGPLAAIASYVTAAADLGPLMVGILALLLLLGVVIWLIERPGHTGTQVPEDSVANLRDGLYWAVVTMTTVGYGDKTPKTHLGRLVAVVWMFSSVALVSLLSASLISRLTAERVENSVILAESDLSGKKLAAVAQSSGAEYLDGLHLKYEKYDNLADALSSLANRRSNAVVNSEGTLRYLVAARFAEVIRVPRSLLAPAFMAIALPEHSPLKKPIDRALIKITAGPEWKSVEDRYFGR
ncbi:MAG TPA: transporter substrate-binding domain-containing protein [Methylocella sp.]|jgi:ABC-type amino acid transport substrate-binding protein|nr:transporter substrate-binding domain-containing protein [Methylocella sp.]